MRQPEYLGFFSIVSCFKIQLEDGALLTIIVSQVWKGSLGLSSPTTCTNSVTTVKNPFSRGTYETSSWKPLLKELPQLS